MPILGTHFLNNGLDTDPLSYIFFSSKKGRQIRPLGLISLSTVVGTNLLLVVGCVALGLGLGLGQTRVPTGGSGLSASRVWSTVI